MGVSRRQVLIGATAAAALAVVGGYELVENRVVPGKTRLDKLLGACGSAPPVPTATPGPMVRGSFASKARNTEVRYTIAYPPGSTTQAELPVIIALPGRGGNQEAVFSSLAMQSYLAM